MDEWVRHVLVPILEGNVPEAEAVKRFGNIALLSADTDRIKEYVFESPRLPEIRGASMILDELNQGLLDDPGHNICKIFAQKGLPVGQRGNSGVPSCIIYVGGGSLLALVPESLASELVREIEALYPRVTGTATISCVFQKVTGEDVLNRLDVLMARQALLLRKKKEEKELLPFFETIPYARRCESCGFRPAACKVTEPELRWLCWPCKKKLDCGKGQRSRWSRCL